MAAPHHEHLWDTSWVLETLVVGVGWGGSSPRSYCVLTTAFSRGSKIQKQNFHCCYILQAYPVWENLDCAFFCRIIFSKLGWRDMGAAWGISVSEIFLPSFFLFFPPVSVPLPPFAPAFLPFSLLLSCISFLRFVFFPTTPKVLVWDSQVLEWTHHGSLYLLSSDYMPHIFLATKKTKVNKTSFR